MNGKREENVSKFRLQEKVERKKKPRSFSPLVSVHQHLNVNTVVWNRWNASFVSMVFHFI